MTVVKLKLSALCLAILVAAAAATPPSRAKPQARAGTERIRYSYLSQRLLNQKELARFKDVFGLSIAVKMRLSNESDWYIEYLASSTGSVIPVGYHSFRKIGEINWRYTSPARGRECLPGCEFKGDGYRWLQLPPGGAVEFEAHDWADPEQEHAFTAFVKADPDKKPVEIVSDVFRPSQKQN